MGKKQNGNGKIFFMKFDLNLMKLTNNDFQYYLLMDGNFPKKGKGCKIIVWVKY